MSTDRDRALTLERYGRSVTSYVLSIDVEIGDVLVRWGLTVRQTHRVRRRGLPWIEVYGVNPGTGNGYTLWFEVGKRVEIQRQAVVP